VANEAHFNDAVPTRKHLKETVQKLPYFKKKALVNQLDCLELKTHLNQKKIMLTLQLFFKGLYH